MKKLGKDILWNTIGSTLNAFNSFFLLIIVTRINGLDVAGSFTFAFSISMIFAYLSIYINRAYQISDISSYNQNKTYLYLRLITSMLTVILAFAFISINGYSFFKSSLVLIFCLFRCFEALSDTYYGILQKNNELALTGKLLTSKSLLSLFCFFLVDYLTLNVVWGSVAFSLVFLLYFIFIDYHFAKKYFEKENKVIKIKELLKNGFFTFAFNVLSVYILNATRYPVDNFLDGEAQTIYGVIIMPATVITLIMQFIIQPVLVKITTCFNEGKIKEMVSLTRKVMYILLGFSFIVMLICYIIGIPLLELVYNIDLKYQKLNLMIVILGATFYALSMILSTVLIVMHKTKVQLLIFLINSVLAYILANSLVQNLSLFGGFLSYTIIMLIQFIFYVIAYKYSIIKISKKLDK